MSDQEEMQGWGDGEAGVRECGGTLVCCMSNQLFFFSPSYFYSLLVSISVYFNNYVHQDVIRDQ